MLIDAIRDKMGDLLFLIFNLVSTGSSTEKRGGRKRKKTKKFEARARAVTFPSFFPPWTRRAFFQKKMSRDVVLKILVRLVFKLGLLVTSAL